DSRPAPRAVRRLDVGDRPGRRRRPDGRHDPGRHPGDDPGRPARRRVAGRAAAREGGARRRPARRVPRSPAAGAARPGDGMRLERVRADGVDRLRDLWLELHAHHQAVAPELAPYVDDDASWAVRRAFYADVLGHGGVALVARDGDRDLGYALAGAEPAPWPATF